MTTITSTQTAKSVSFSAPFASPVQRKTMSITQTYFLAHKARSKLSHQAARPDHNLRLLVGHANLLDTLMLELADAEREQESWFNQSVRGASQQQQSQSEKDRHVQWADTVIEEPEEDWQAEDADDSDASSDSSSDFDSDEEDDEEDSEESLPEDDIDMADAVPLRRVASHHQSKPIVTTVTVVEDEVSEADSSDDEVDDDEEDYAQLTLTRSPSQHALPSARSPPELVVSADDSDDASEDEAMPPSPPTITMQSFKKHHKKSTDVAHQASSPETATQQELDVNDRCYLPPRNPARLVSTISVF